MSQANKRIILLGAGGPGRGASHSLLRRVNNDQRTLDWLLNCFSSLGWEESIVLGYQAEAVAALYPKLSYSINPNWAETGAVASLFCSPFPNSTEAFVAYSDILFEKDSVDRLLHTPGDVVVLVDSFAEKRYEGRSRTDLQKAEWLSLSENEITADKPGKLVEFAGLVLFRDAGIHAAAELWRTQSGDFSRTMLGELLNALNQKLPIKAVDVQGAWAELTAPQDLSRFILGTKAHTLHRLCGMLHSCSIPDYVIVNVGAWQTKKSAIFATVAEKFAGDMVAVRSSSHQEDTWSNSNAGRFSSFLNVPSDDIERFADAVNAVIRSYGNAAEEDLVLVQRMVRNVAAAGVVFTRSVDRGAPYFIVNYDMSGVTDSITSGSQTASQTFVARKSCVKACSERIPAELRAVLTSVMEIERVVGHDALDIEFALDKDGGVYLLQVRPLTADFSRWKVEDEEIEQVVNAAKDVFTSCQKTQPFIPGSKAPFSIMTDWNPAEIIGTCPRMLAYSLYRYLITDSVWARQRAEFGYRDVRPCPLVRLFAGQPYVDIRACFVSFIPSALPDSLAERLADHYLDKFYQAPELFDKVEFAILHTCLDFSWEKHRTNLFSAGFSRQDIDMLESALRKITAAALHRPENELRSAAQLEARFRRISAADVPLLDKAGMLLEDALSGTLAFAHLARMGFIAASLLKSAVAENIVAPQRVDAFMRSLDTVTNALRTDACKVKNGTLPLDAFVAEYGHLRPGTYDITIPCYSADVERYLHPIFDTVEPAHREVFCWSKEEAVRLEDALCRLGLPENWAVWETFLRNSIEGRERSKFMFTRNLSGALDVLRQWAEAMGCTLDELSHLSIEDILAWRLGQGGLTDVKPLKKRAQLGEASSRVVQAVKLPPVLLSENDFDMFCRQWISPNFIGTAIVAAPVVIVNSNTGKNRELDGKIVVIPQADPGYDWLFASKLAGLVTCYGGANSHMAIRAAEMGIPAAIGVGEHLYTEICSAHMLRLDPVGNRLETLW